MERALVLLLLVCLVLIIKVVHSEPVFAYAESGKITIKKVLSGGTVKVFKITEYSDVHVAIHYQEDLIFYIRDEKLYRIHMVDENGDRLISGKGQLFTDPNVDHVEVLLVKLNSDATGMALDEANNKLYIITGYRGNFEMDLEGKNQKIFGRELIRDPIIYKGEMYFTFCGNNFRCGVYRATLGGAKMITSKDFEELVSPLGGTYQRLAIDEASTKLFFRMQSAIHVLDLNLPKSSYPVQSTNARVVIGNSQFTGGNGAIAVVGRNLIFNNYSSSRGRFLLGILNTAMTFISKKNIYVYGKESYQFRPKNIIIFHHQFMILTTQKPISTTAPPKLCPCTSS